MGDNTSKNYITMDSRIDNTLFGRDYAEEAKPKVPPKDLNTTKTSKRETLRKILMRNRKIPEDDSKPEKPLPAFYISKTGAKVRPVRDMTTKSNLKQIQRAKELTEEMSKIRKELHGTEGRRKNVLTQIMVEKSRFGKMKEQRVMQNRIKEKRKREKEKWDNLVPPKKDEIEEELVKKYKGKKVKKKEVHRTKMMEYNENQLKNLLKYKGVKIHAKRKRKWAGEEGEFKESDVKDYNRHFDAYQIFNRGNKKDYKFTKNKEKEGENKTKTKTEEENPKKKYKALQGFESEKS